MSAPQRDELPTNSGIPRVMRAEEAASSAIEIRSRGWRASVPGALIIALVTSLTTAATVRYSGSPSEGRGSERLQRVEERLSSIESTQRTMLEALNRTADEARNARAIDALDKAQIKLRLDSLENRVARRTTLP